MYDNQKIIKICFKAIETYGAESQVDKTIEEMSELTKALLKERRYGGSEADIPASKLIAIAKLFGVSVDWLLGFSEESIKPPKKVEEPSKAEKKPTESCVTKVVISTPNMNKKQLELLVRAYTDLSKEEVRGLHNSRAIQVRWSESR